MDPQACFEELLVALEYGEYDEAEAHARDLKEWLGRGGFPVRGYSQAYVQRCISAAIRRRVPA